MIKAGQLFARCRDGFVRYGVSIVLAATAVLSPQGAAFAQQMDSRVETGDIRGIQNDFDSMFGTDKRAPKTYASPFAQQLAVAANAGQGRIGVAAMDLSSGSMVDVLGNQRFPMASTSKIAIAATFLDGVDKGKWSLSSEFPLMVPVASAPFSSAIAPVRAGEYMTAERLIEIMITRSNNYATDALLKVVGGPKAVNAWVARAGIDDWQLDRDIATLVRDDGAIDPARVVDVRDSATPNAMVKMLAGLYQGKWLSPSSRRVILGAMSRCVTGKRRIPAGLPAGVSVSHKTGSLNNTSSDVGIIEAPDGRVYAVAIYVTGQGSRPGREARIANIARTIYNGYLQEGPGYARTAAR